MDKPRRRICFYLMVKRTLFSEVLFPELLASFPEGIPVYGVLEFGILESAKTNQKY